MAKIAATVHAFRDVEKYARVVDLAEIEKNDWKPLGLSVVVRDGIVHLSGIITDERARQEDDGIGEEDGGDGLVERIPNIPSM